MYLLFLVYLTQSLTRMAPLWAMLGWLVVEILYYISVIIV